MSAADHQRTDGRDHAAGRPQRWRVYHADAEPSGDQGMEVWVGPHDCPSFWMEKGGRGEQPTGAGGRDDECQEHGLAVGCFFAGKRNLEG